MKLKDLLNSFNWNQIYLTSNSSFSNKNYQIISYSILIIWLVLALLMVMNHAVWRDEMRAYVIADEASNIFEIPKLLVNDGHPPLWHILLFIVNIFVKSPVTLQITAITISTVSVFLFFKYSPFINLHKILFIFGIIPFYEYTIFARNYGISMLLMILATFIITQKNTRILTFYVILSLLALTNIHSNFLSPFFVFLYFISYTNEKNQRFWIYHALGLVILFVSSIYSAHIALPNEDSLYYSSFPKIPELFNEGLTQVFIFGEGFRSIFFGYHPILQLLTFWLLALSLLRKPVLTLVFITVMIGFGIFFNIGYQPRLRHEGLFYIFTIMLYWLYISNKFNGRIILKKIDTRFIRFSSTLVFTFLLLIQVKYAVDASVRELKYPASNSKEFARFINENSQFKNAIILGEPDTYLESLPYYLNNKIYFPREKRFGRRVNLTTVRKSRLTMNELIEDANHLHKEYKDSPILILIGYSMNEKSNVISRKDIGSSFEWDQYQLKNLHNNTDFIKSFRGSLTGEDYDVFLFIP